MVDMVALRQDINVEVSAILSSNFHLDVTKTSYVPHSDDGAITFPNLDERTQGAKFIETTVLYVDMRRSTALSMKHRTDTVARLYSAFVRGMARCAGVYGGEVRGIIGDRVMMLFESENCFANAVDTGILINSVCQHVINKHFLHNEVTFGIGIDHGNMLATKTGIRRRGSAQQSYRSLVWLGRPANVASKLTDHANKPEESTDLIKVNVAYDYFGTLIYTEEWPHDFVKHFTHSPANGLMIHDNPRFHSFTALTQRTVTKAATPPILMTKRVFDGFRSARPQDRSIQNNWFESINVRIPDYSDGVYGGDVVFTAFTT